MREPFLAMENKHETADKLLPEKAGEGESTLPTIAKNDHADSSDAVRGSELLSLLLKNSPLESQQPTERSKTPPVQPTISREEASRPLTPPARLLKNLGSAPGSPSNKRFEKRRMQRPALPPHTRGVNMSDNKGEYEEKENGKVSEHVEKRVNELGLEVKEGEGPQGPVARWRLQRNGSAADDRALQNKPKGPDGTKGFAAGRGKPLTPPATATIGEPPAGVAEVSNDVSEKRRSNGGHKGGVVEQQKDLELQLKIAQFLVGRELEAGGEKTRTREEGSSARPSTDEEAPFAPPPSRQGSRKGEGSPAGSVSGDKADISLTTVDESKPVDQPLVREEPSVGPDLQKLTQLLEGAFGAGRSVPGAGFIARAADEWLETDLAAARDKVFAVLDKSIGMPGYGELVDLEKHLKATLTELRRFRKVVESEAGGASGAPPKEQVPPPREGLEKLEGEVLRLRYELGAAQAEIGRLEAELAFERANRGVENGASEGGGRELERVRLELRAWQGEVEKLKGALERSEEFRREEEAAAVGKLQAKETECSQLQHELAALRDNVRSTEETLRTSIDSERQAWTAELDRLRTQTTSDAEEIGRLRSQLAANSEEFGRLRLQLASADTGFGPASGSDRRSGRETQQGYGGVMPGANSQQHYEGGGMQDILSQLLSKPPSGTASGMTWQQQDLTRQQERPSSGGQMPSEGPSSTQLTWQQQEMTRAQRAIRIVHPSGGHGKPPVLHETDLAFAHQQRLLAEQRQFPGGQFQGHLAPPSAPPLPRYPTPNTQYPWETPAMLGVPASRGGSYSHLTHQGPPGQQRMSPGAHQFPQGPPPFWQQSQARPPLARTASAVEQELLGRTRSGQSFGFSSAMPIPVSVLLAAGRNAPKQAHTMAPPTSEELGLIEDDEVIFKGR